VWKRFDLILILNRFEKWRFDCDLNHIWGKWFDLILNNILDDFWIPCKLGLKWNQSSLNKGFEIVVTQVPFKEAAKTRKNVSEYPVQWSGGIVLNGKENKLSTCFLWQTTHVIIFCFEAVLIKTGKTTIMQVNKSKYISVLLLTFTSDTPDHSRVPSFLP
jgi:hypothetical protein